MDWIFMLCLISLMLRTSSSVFSTLFNYEYVQVNVLYVVDATLGRLLCEILVAPGCVPKLDQGNIYSIPHKPFSCETYRSVLYVFS